MHPRNGATMRYCVPCVIPRFLAESILKSTRELASGRDDNQELVLAGSQSVEKSLAPSAKSIALQDGLH